MNIRCKLFGHALPEGWCGGAPYLRVGSVGQDHIDRVHVHLYGECPRCGEEWHICSMHANSLGDLFRPPHSLRELKQGNADVDAPAGEKSQPTKTDV